jgi:tRNA A-37 threonylcarbamoyl transferase component Bud32
VRDRVCFAAGEQPERARADGVTFDVLAEAPARLFKVHRTGDVGRLAAEATPFRIALVRKRYWYPTFADRRKGALRTTWLAPSRVAREAKSLERLAALGLQPPLAVAWGERRSLGVLHDSFLLLRELDATDFEALLRDERGAARRRAALADLGTFVGRMHGAGVVDGDLHLRNFLRGRDGAIAKIDSPFARAVGRRRRGSALARDLADLTFELVALAAQEERLAFVHAYSAALGIPPPARGA